MEAGGLGRDERVWEVVDMVAMLEGRWGTVMVVTNCQDRKLERRMELMVK